MSGAPAHVVDQLRAARALIASGAAWTIEALGRDADGAEIEEWVDIASGRYACSWCAYGALMHVAREQVPVGDSFLEKAAWSLFNGATPDEVNDYIGHAAVLAMYDHAIELAWEAIGR